MRAVELAVLLLLAGCTEKNPLYCDHDGDCQSGSCDKALHTCAVIAGDGGADAPPPLHCVSDMDCPSMQPHCMDGICRECLTSSDCTGGKICASDHSCGSCASDDDCRFAGGACEGGLCPPASDVAWVDCARVPCPGDGSAATPFCLLSQAADSGRPYVVMTPRACVYDSAEIQDRVQEIDGRGATVSVPPSGSGIRVTGAQSDVFAHDLMVTSTVTTSQVGIMAGTDGHLRVENVTVFGLPGSASTAILADNGNLTVRKSLVYMNAGWGVQLIDSTYRVENTFVVGNGSTIGTPMGGSGGVRIRGASAGTFVYTTVARNVFEVPPPPAMPKGAGVWCEPAATLLDSLLIENTQGVNIVDTQGACNTSQGTGTVTTTTALPQTANEIFVNPTQPQDSLMPAMGFHVKTSATMVIHKGVLQPSPTAPDDVDGDLRPAMTTPGADEPLP